MNLWDQRYLGLAQYVASWSKDPSTKVGAVVVNRRNQIMSMGFNGLPRGVADTDERLNDRDVKLSMIVHAEMNALAFTERSVQRCTLYTWPFMPCSRCAGIIIQHGITRVVAPNLEPKSWEQSFLLTRRMFSEAGVLLDLYTP